MNALQQIAWAILLALTAASPIILAIMPPSLNANNRMLLEHDVLDWVLTGRRSALLSTIRECAIVIEERDLYARVLDSQNDPSPIWSANAWEPGCATGCDGKGGG